MSRPRTMRGRKMVSLPDEIWNAVDTYRFQHRFRTEAEALRSLVEAGLRAEHEKAPADASA